VRQFPEKWQNRVRTIRSDLFGVLGKWARAQIILMGVTFAELFMAFMLFKIRPALTLAIVIAVIDMLPVLGTGTVLIPWAVLMLLAGRFGLATQLAITYGVVSIVRSCLEPKIIGSGMGLHPAATLLAMYMGYCLMGVAGIILFPFLLLFLKQLNDSEYIRLWK
jgi:sporulation integral membrane protein YtvI